MSPKIPVLIYDGECGFCRRWIERWKKATGGAVAYKPFQQAGPQYPAVPMSAFAKSVYLFTPDGGVCSGAEAVFRSLAFGGITWPYFLYRHLPGFRWISERGYQFVARNRSWL